MSFAFYKSSVAALLGCLFFAFTSAESLAAGRTLSETEIIDCAEAYFAPMTPGIWRMRMPDGEIREFHSVPNRDREIVSEDGWRGTIDGASVVLSAPNGHPVKTWKFVNGRLDRIYANGRWCGLAYPEEVIYHGEEPPPLWPEPEFIPESAKFPGDLWAGGSRLRLWFESPNQAAVLMAMLAVLGLCGALYFTRWLRWASAAWTWGCAILLLLTKSRGGFVAFAAAAFAALVCHFHARGFTLRKMLPYFAGVALAVGVAGATVVCCAGRDGKARKGSDANRMVLVEAGARMFADAPFGWSGFGSPGFIYETWYRNGERDCSKAPRFNLVSDHLTRVAYGGWLRGGVYAAVWLVGLAILGVFAWRGGSIVPLTQWLTLAIGASFNVVLAEGVLWALPLFSLGLVPAKAKALATKWTALAAVAGLALTAAALGALNWYGEAKSPARPTIRCRDSRVMIAARNPRIWLAGDMKVLGMIGTGPTIRRYLAADRRRPGIGYVQDLSALPESAAIDRLVISGRHGRRFLDAFASGQIKAPAKIVFLSPDFLPSEIPETLLKAAEVRYVIGEFAARYDSESPEYPRWVTVVKGSEGYIPGWMKYVVGES